MNKHIIHPGNGINFPKKGDYVKINLLIYDSNKNILFDNQKNDNKCLDIRYDCLDSNIIKELEELIGEMSLFEKCSLEINHLENKNEEYENFIELLNKHNKLIFEIEIVDISSFSHK